jgi:hypothetical protein
VTADSGRISKLVHNDIGIVYGDQRKRPSIVPTRQFRQALFCGASTTRSSHNSCNVGCELCLLVVYHLCGLVLMLLAELWVCDIDECRRPLPCIRPQSSACPYSVTTVTPNHLAVVTDIPAGVLGTMWENISSLAVAGIAMIALPPSDQLAPIVKSTCRPTPLNCLVSRVSALTCPTRSTWSAE